MGDIMAKETIKKIDLDSVIKSVAGHMAVIAQHKGVAKESQEIVKQAKLDVFSSIIADVVDQGIELTGAGLMPTAWSRPFKDELFKTHGVKESTTDRYVQLTAKMLKHSELGVDLRNCVGADQVKNMLGQYGLKTQSDIDKFVNPVNEIDRKAQKEAKYRLGLEQADPKDLVVYENLVDQYLTALRESAKKQAEELAQAKAEAESDAEAINQFGDDLELAS
jgi:hypothetical protein